MSENRTCKGAEAERAWWPIPKTSNFEGIGLLAERDGQLGYIKCSSLRPELLASNLAKKCGAAVPEFTTGVLPNGEAVGISVVHSERSRPIAQKSLAEAPLALPDERCLTKASALLPFLCWVAAYDHFDNTNLVCDDLGHSEYRVVAIDFADAFGFEFGADDMRRPEPSALLKHIDRHGIMSAIQSIERVSDDELLEACLRAGFDEICAGKLVSVLGRRRDALRAAFDEPPYCMGRL